MAANRVSRPSKAPIPTATSPSAITAPSSGAAPTRWPRTGPIGLVCAAPAIWAWMEPGAEVRKKSGLASFCSPAKRKVAPRKSRSGSRYHPGAIDPSGPRTCHMVNAGGTDVVLGDPERATAALCRRAALEVIGLLPWGDDTG